MNCLYLLYTGVYYESSWFCLFEDRKEANKASEENKQLWANYEIGHKLRANLDVKCHRRRTDGLTFLQTLVIVHCVQLLSYLLIEKYALTLHSKFLWERP